MQRRLRVTLAATAAAGAAVFGAGTAYAQGAGTSPATGGHGHHDSDDCTYKVEKDQPELESDFPSDHLQEAKDNTTRNDAVDSHGEPYYTHNKECSYTPRPWRGFHWDDDKSYDTFGWHGPYDNHANSYNDFDGYNKNYHYDEKHLEPKHIGQSRDHHRPEHFDPDQNDD